MPFGARPTSLRLLSACLAAAALLARLLAGPPLTAGAEEGTPAVLHAAEAASASAGATMSAAGSVASTGTPEDIAGAIVAVAVGADRVGSGVAISPTRVLTSMNVLRSNGIPSLLVNGALVPFTVETSDTASRLAVLRPSVELPTVPVRFGDSGALPTDATVYALGFPSDERRILVYKGTVKSPALATGGELLLTDIPIDPLVEGGALVTPDGRLVGIIVARAQGMEEGQLGWAVTSAAVRQVLDRRSEQVRRQRKASREEIVRRWTLRGVFAVVLALLVVSGRWFSGWYRRMEERELAKEAAEAAAGGGTTPAEDAASGGASESAIAGEPR